MTLWEICEDDPAVDHLVTDEGRLVPSARCIQGVPAGPPETILDSLAGELRASGAECCSCRYCDLCAGYFKVPDRSYSCEHVKRVFAALEGAAAEVQKDLRTLGGE